MIKSPRIILYTRCEVMRAHLVQVFVFNLRSEMQGQGNRDGRGMATKRGCEDHIVSTKFDKGVRGKKGEANVVQHYCGDARKGAELRNYG